MKLPFIPSKSSISDKPIVALDIGTEFIKTVLFYVEEDHVRIINANKLRQQNTAMKGGAIANLESVVETAKVAIAELVKGLPKKSQPDNVIMGIGGEFVHGVSIVANYDREVPSDKIDETEVKHVMENIKQEAFEEAAHNLSENIGVEEDQILIVNANITDTYIDNFRVSNPLGFQGKNVQFNVFASFSPAIHFNSLKHISDELGRRALAIVAEPFVVSQAYKRSDAEGFGGIFIDIGGGSTDIAVVRKGGVVDTQMFAFGGRVFTKRIAADLNLDYKQAEDMKVRYSSGKLSDEIERKVRKAILKDIEVWVSGVELALSEIDDVDIYPSEIFLCGGGSLLPEIREALVEYPWVQVLEFNKMPKVKFLNVQNLRNVIDETDSLNEPSDVTPVALARYALDVIKDEVI